MSTFFKHAPALLPACRRLDAARPIFSPQIPADVKARIVQLLPPAAMQTGAVHALQEVETWLRDNQLIITKEHECVSQSPAPGVPSEATSPSP